MRSLTKGASVETTGFGGSAPEPGDQDSAQNAVAAFAPSPLDPEWKPSADQGVVVSTSAPTTTQPETAPVAPPPAAPAPQAAAPLVVPGLAPADAPAPQPSAPATEAPEASTGTTLSVPLAPVADVAPAPAPVQAPTPVPAATPAPSPVAEPAPVAATPAETTTQPSAGADAGQVELAETEAFEGAYGRTTTEERPSEGELNLHELLSIVLDRQASDLHLTTGSRPQLRLHGHLTPLEDYPELTPSVIQRLMYAAITQRQREKFEENLELDFAYSVPGKARFRVNLYRQRDSLGAAFRLIPFEIKRLEDLGIPPSVANFAMLPRGFVLVTGPTGSGKSTTLAALVDLANRQRRDHIMTVEDPIEFLHQHQSCVVNQREVGEDTHSFSNALKHVLRQDPDIILVGEMRDLETISVALTAAETGHLVFATLHTQDAAQTIDRVIDVFPPHQQQQVRVQLAGSLQGVVCQTLARTVDGQGRAVATEVLVATPAVRNLVREGKTHQIYSAMQAGAQHGMHTLDQHLAELVKKGKITYEVGLEKCHHIEDFNRLTGRG